jgi:Flp pilus assembly protein TadG
MKRWLHKTRKAEGSEVAEMAMVLPVMFLVFLAIFWAGRSYNIYSTVNQAARAGARIAAQSTCASCTDAFGADAAVDTAISSSLQADRLNPASITAANPVPSPTFCLSPPTGACSTTPNGVSVCRNAQLTPTGVTPVVCGVIVEFTYPLDLQQIPLMSAFGNPHISGRAQTSVEQ